ncbi:MAG TPA: hypothetical protein VLD37_04465 [Candidatus Bilamarchaeum sp.]|nr:hypothetical protein [Candidatus Bilamarchaeum sp.]
MNEYMLLIRNMAGHDAAWPDEKHGRFLKECEDYIGGLKSEGRLIAAQPLIREGAIVSGARGALKVSPLDASGEVQVGYYHILAKDLEEAVSIARRNPEFSFSDTARVEVRPVKAKESDTGFLYPKGI